MSLQDDYFDLIDWMKDAPPDIRKSFNNIWDYSIEAEAEIVRLLQENNAMKKVIQIVKQL